MRLTNKKIAHLEEISDGVSSERGDDLRPREIAEITMPYSQNNSAGKKQVIYVLGKSTQYSGVLVADKTCDAKTGFIVEPVRSCLYQIDEIIDYKTIKKLRRRK